MCSPSILKLLQAIIDSWLLVLRHCSPTIYTFIPRSILRFQKNKWHSQDKLICNATRWSKASKRRSEHGVGCEAKSLICTALCLRSWLLLQKCQSSVNSLALQPRSWCYCFPARSLWNLSLHTAQKLWCCQDDWAFGTSCDSRDITLQHHQNDTKASIAGLLTHVRRSKQPSNREGWQALEI